MSTVFAYPTSTWNFIIIKRNPFNYHITKMDPKTGDLYNEILQGKAITLPIWEWKKTNIDGSVHAGMGPYTYDITDLESDVR